MELIFLVFEPVSAAYSSSHVKCSTSWSKCHLSYSTLWGWAYAIQLVFLIFLRFLKQTAKDSVDVVGL